MILARGVIYVKHKRRKGTDFFRKIVVNLAKLLPLLARANGLGALALIFGVLNENCGFVCKLVNIQNAVRVT